MELDVYIEGAAEHQMPKQRQSPYDLSMAPFVHLNLKRKSRFSGGTVKLQRDLWRHGELLDSDGYRAGPAFARAIREAGANGIVYPSLRHDGGRCLCLFYPDLAGRPRLGRRLDLHWGGKRVDAYRLDGQERGRQLP